MTEGWDWEAQKADTEAVWQELSGYPELERGAAINLDLQFVAGEAADRTDKAAFVMALRERGYALEIYTNDEDEETVQATVATTFDPAAIWQEEERGTRLALEHGYRPDGWGFWEPET